MIAVADDVDQYKQWWEESQWEPLMASLVPRVRAIFVMRRVDPDVVDDLTQETLVRCWRQKIVPDHPVRFATTVAINLLRDNHKNPRNRLRAEGDEAGKALEQLEDPDEDPLETIIAEADRTLLREALRVIPDGFRRPLILAAFHQKTAVELAEQFGGTPGAMKMRLSRARKLLVRALTGDGLPQRRGRTPEYLKRSPAPMYRVETVVVEGARSVTATLVLHSIAGKKKIATFCLSPEEWKGSVGRAVRAFDPMMAGASASV